MEDLSIYAQKIWETGKLIWAMVLSGLCWALFPETAYQIQAIVVGVAVFLDLLTKLWAITINHKGVRKAIKAGAINGDILWHRTKIKLFSYFVVMILAGLSGRIAPFRLPGMIAATVAMQSCISDGEYTQNLIASGSCQLEPLLSI